MTKIADRTLFDVVAEERDKLVTAQATAIIAHNQAMADFDKGIARLDDIAAKVKARLAPAPAATPRAKRGEVYGLVLAELRRHPDEFRDAATVAAAIEKNIGSVRRALQRAAKAGDANESDGKFWCEAPEADAAQ